MSTKEIISRCISKLGMREEEAKWVCENLYRYSVPDWSEMSWGEIDRMLLDTLKFKPVETTAIKLRVGDTVKVKGDRVGKHVRTSWRVIARVERFPNCVQVWDDLGELHQFEPGEKVETQLLELV